MPTMTLTPGLWMKWKRFMLGHGLWEEFENTVYLPYCERLPNGRHDQGAKYTCLRDYVTGRLGLEWPDGEQPPEIPNTVAVEQAIVPKDASDLDFSRWDDKPPVSTLTEAQWIHENVWNPTANCYSAPSASAAVQWLEAQKSRETRMQIDSDAVDRISKAEAKQGVSFNPFVRRDNGEQVDDVLNAALKATKRRVPLKSEAAA